MLVQLNTINYFFNNIFIMIGCVIFGLSIATLNIYFLYSTAVYTYEIAKYSNTLNTKIESFQIEKSAVKELDVNKITYIIIPKEIHTAANINE